MRFSFLLTDNIFEYFILATCFKSATLIRVFEERVSRFDDFGLLYCDLKNYNEIKNSYSI